MGDPDFSELWLGHIILEGCHHQATCFREQGFKIVCPRCLGAYSGLVYSATAIAFSGLAYSGQAFSGLAYSGPSMVDIGPGQYLLRAFIWDPSHFPIYEDPHISACC